MVKKSVVALGMVGVLVVVFAVCLVSAVQLLSPREMPFGVTGTSSVVDAVLQKYTLDTKTYATESDLRAAAEAGDIYGGYVPGSSTGTLYTVEAKSFFGDIYLTSAFEEAAKANGDTLTVTSVVPLPTEDRTGGVVGLLLLPTLIGGYLVASLLYSTSQTAAAPGRMGLVLAFSAVAAVITGVVAGPILGAIPISQMWTLIPCFFLVTAAVSLSAVALQALVGKLGSLLVALLFIVIGGAGAGGGGVSLLPTYWQALGNLFPPRHAIELYRNVRYFDGHNIVKPIAVLGLYAVVSAVVIVVRTRHSSTEADSSDSQVPTGDARLSTSDPALEVGGADRRRFVPKDLVAPVVFSLLLTTLFAVNYTSSGHQPVANKMSFGVVGSTALAEAAQNPLFSLDLTSYDDQDDVTAAMDRGEIYGAIVTNPDGSSELTVVSTISDLSPLDIVKNFEQAATTAGEKLTTETYAPTPLAPKDPFALVPATVLVALLVGGYMSAAMLTTATGAASRRWRGVWLLGFAAFTGLAVDLAVTYWLQGFPERSFWIAWPILSLIILAVSLFTAVLRRVLGPAGVVVTLIVVLQFGNPSSGGSNGAAYLPSFWNDIGPFLPPRNAYLLLRNTLYFDGNGVAQPLAVLAAYVVVAAALIAFLDWFRSPVLEAPGLDEDDAAGAATVAIPIGPLP
ncbi:MAG: hypothetical protein ACK5O2_02490 [Microthrixaceae bacterium]